MISISGKSWSENKINKNVIEKLKQDFNFTEIVSKIIINRGFDEKEIYSINNEIKLSNVFSNNKDFDKSINILLDAINNRTKICILGDYDVDGSVSSSLLSSFFSNINQPHFVFIPDREKDGYGASKKLFQKLILKKPGLIIMVDCGSTSIEAVDFLNKNNIKSIIIDHHEINKPYPSADSIINPKKNDGYERYDYLCASALTYFFIDLLSKKTKNHFKINDNLIYILLATVCDVMPLRKLNRVIAIKALRNFDITKNKILNEIYSIKKLNKKINVTDLGYLIGPILNSGGRLGKSNFATKLLSSNDDILIKKLSSDLIKLNEKRKKIEERILLDINYKKIDEENKDINVLFDPNINEGLIGIIAARLTDYFNKPCIVITMSNNLLKGSARSIYNFNIGSLIKNAVDTNILIKGGGHSMAAGFTLKKSNLVNFKVFINSFYSLKNLKINNTKFYDSKISASAFNHEFYKDIKSIEPFGNGNAEPLFLIEDLKIIKTKIINKKHILTIFKSKSGKSINSLAFNCLKTNVGKYLLNYKKNLNVIGQIQENFWNNKNTLQLIIKDLLI